MAVVRSKLSDFDTKLKREVELLLYLKELRPREVIAIYGLRPEAANRLGLWSHRAGKKYKKLSPEEQEKARVYAMQRFTMANGPIGTALAKISNSTENISDDPDMKAFARQNGVVKESVTVCNTPDKVNETVEAGNTNLPSKLQTVESSGTNQQSFDETLLLLKSNGLSGSLKRLNVLQNSIAGELDCEINTITNVISKLFSFSNNDLSLKDIKMLMDTLEKAIATKRKALVLPYGSIDPNTKPATPNNAQHLHLHNHGLQSFDPNQS